MSKSNIEWTEETWNPIVGCSILSPGCTNCYAMSMARRIEGMNAANRAAGRPVAAPQYDGTTRVVNDNPVWTGRLNRASDNILLSPLKRKKPTMYFVNSMSDLFHEDVPDEWIDQIFAVMALCPQHTFQVLTKRAKRMREYFDPQGCVSCGDGQLDGKCCDEPCVLKDGSGAAFRDAMIEGAAQKIFSQIHPGFGEPSEWLAVHMPLPNVWLGVSTERQQEADERIPDLLNTPAAVRFISAEPLLGPLDISPYLGDHPVYGGMQTERGICLPSCDERRSGDHAGRHDLARSQEGMGPLAEESNQPSVQESEGGTRLRRLFPSSDHAGREESLRPGPSLGLPAFQGSNSGGTNGQSRGWHEKTEPPGQSGTSNLFRAAVARDAHTEGGPRMRSERDEEQHGKIDATASSSDSQTPSERGAAAFDSPGLPHQLSGGIEDRTTGSLGGIIWTIVGGESGDGYRDMNPDWARAIRDQCVAAGVPIFVKQMAGRKPIPDDLQIRQFPSRG